MSQYGKIARLPKAVREQLNRRMEDGDRGADLLAWLNGLPEAQQIVASEFGGHPIEKHNLYQWRKWGFREWQRQQELVGVARALADEGGELEQDTIVKLSDRVGVYLVARYARAARDLMEDGGEPEWKRLREVCHDVVALRRSDHSAQRLKFAEERLKQDCGLTDDEILEHFQKWVRYGKVKEWVLNEDERREDRLKKLLGMVASDAEEAECEEAEEFFEEEGGTGI